MKNPANERMNFGKQMERIELRRNSWLEKAEQSVPELFRTERNPVAVVEVEKDEAAFQSWEIGGSAPVASVCNKPLLPGDGFILDFGEHWVGYLEFSLRAFGIPVDAPVRLRFVFGETLAEVAEPFDPYEGTLPRSWLQDETVNVDVVPQTIRLPRRYAFRFVKVEVVSSSRHGKFGFSNLRAEAVTSADADRIPPFRPDSAEDAALDRVSLATLRDCMQTVFEDGPKRDRRLWLGDLRLQALANYATFRNYGLVKRSLYLLAGTATEEGLVSTCAMERPEPVRGANSILDYTALFASTVLEYLEASGDRETAEDLWPLVAKQLEFTLGAVDAEGLLKPSDEWWLFIDWNRSLDKQASEQGVIICGLEDTFELARRLGRQGEVSFIPAVVVRMRAAARKHLWDEALGLFVSGGHREVSWISQAWMVLAGVPAAEQGKRALQNAMASPTALKPVSPYANHYVVEALLEAGLVDEAKKLLHEYWGGMVARGADTFWEVYVPGDDCASPYGSHLVNSYCHAWSCTPSYFLRVRFPQASVERQLECGGRNKR